MQVGFGLPTSIPWVNAAQIPSWAKRAEDLGFSSLSVIDRVVYGNYDPLIALAVAAGATSRVRLVTAVLLATLRDTAILAKEAASLDNLSGGRLTLGLGIGGREDDFLATERSIHTRGRRFDQQLVTLRQIWSGQPFSDAVGPIGPAPIRVGGPELLIGASAPAALERAGRWAAGFVVGPGAPPDQARANYELVRQSWQAAGRPGQPRFVCGTYFALGPNAASGFEFIRSYMPARADAVIRGVPTSPEALITVLKSYAAVGVDECFVWCLVPELDQTDRAAEVVARSGLGAS